jgi:hypothetical protein
MRRRTFLASLTAIPPAALAAVATSLRLIPQANLNTPGPIVTNRRVWRFRLRDNSTIHDKTLSGR